MTASFQSNTQVDYGLKEVDLSSEPQEQHPEGNTKKQHEDHTHVEVDLDKLNGFLQNQAKRVARKPCTYLCSSLVAAIALSAIGIIVGEFSVSANTGGWQSRGTLIADRQTQLMVVQNNQEELFNMDGGLWQDLIDNVQPGWEEDDDETRRRLTASLQDTAADFSQANFMADYLRPKSDRIEISRALSGGMAGDLPFQLTSDLHHKLQDAIEPRGCDFDFYTPANLTHVSRLTPVWKTTREESTVLDPGVLRDVCVAESNTQAHLEEKGLCIPCETGCLPPFSIVLYARLSIDGGFDMTCDELADAWTPLQASTEASWTDCVSEMKQSFDPLDESVPEECPPFFYTTLVGEKFDNNGGKTQYTSSIFATPWSEDLYDEVGNYDRGSGSIEGAYDTQFEDFTELFLEASLTSDMALALGSAVIVAIAIVIHTRSPFIAGIGLIQIILSFPLAYFVYKLVAGLNFFPFLNFIGVFVVFALGAGDVFVAVDKWKNARMEFPKATTEQVAAVALPDALGAMFLTTLTTAVAFFATAICPVAPIKMFAIFCGLLIVFDYIMNVLLVFPALCVYDRAIQTKGVAEVSWCMTCTCFGFLGRKGSDDEEDNDDIESRMAASSSRHMTHQETIDSLEADADNQSLIRRVLFKFYHVVHAIRWPLFVVCWAALALSAYYASTLEQPTNSEVRLLTDSHEYEKSYNWRQNLLVEALEKRSGSQAYFIWGVTPADTGDQNDPDSWTQLRLDSDFEPSEETAQVFLMNFCEGLFQEDFAIEPENGFVCPLTQFDNWLQTQAAAEEPDSIYTSFCNGESGIPVAPENFDECIIAWSQNVDEQSILSRNGKVTVFLFPFTSRIRYDDQYDTQDEEWNLIEDWVKNLNKDAPNSAKNGYFTSEDFWWYDTNGQMLFTAYSAAGIALGCAAAVILFSSRSLILTIFSTLTIGYVLTSVTSMLVAAGWTLGFLESICFAILIGVSVDFVIHLSHAYASVEGDIDRSRRTKYALIKMGPSILATALTTILSAVVMMFTVITFFQKFALILFFTIIQASLGSFIWLVVMVDCIGPANPTFLFDRALEFFLKKKENTNMIQTSRGESDRSDNGVVVY